ncbi:MAG: ParB/RepB/Spo0J family partition protein [Burkholderiales bacterium]
MQLELIQGRVKEAMHEAGASSGDLWKVPIGDIHVIPGFNVRSNGVDHADHLAGLVGSIMANGFYLNRPLAGYVALKDGKNLVYLTDGHCRLEAAQEAIKLGAEIKTLPVVVSPKGTSLEDLTVGLVTNNSGKPLSQFEIGMVCKRLVGFGWDIKEIAKRLSLASPRVDDLLMLVAAPASVRKLVADGTVSATQAIGTLKRDGPKASEKLQAGAEKAKAAGKKKATAKHIDAKPSYRAVVVALLAWAKDSGAAWDSKLKVVLKMAKEASE